MTAAADPRAAKPRNLALAERELAVAWGDGHESYFPFDLLRAHCPCAACRADSRKAAAAGPLRLLRGPLPGALAITRIAPVGAYAVQVEWSDGHDSGIYAFEALRRGCPCADCAARPDAGWR